MTAAARAALPAALLWAVGAAAWNIEGVRRIAAGDQPLGPTASLAGAAIIGVMALAMLWGHRRSRLLLGAVSAVILLGAGFAVWGAFTGTPDMWPSAAWRWGGAALNALGVVSAGILLARAVRPAA